MNIEFTEIAWEDFSYWIDNDENSVTKIKELINAINNDPFKGIGKPEPLKFGLKGFWSRRITDEHRLIYKVKDEAILIAKCRYHYD
jgi:toxin YoeB